MRLSRQFKVCLFIFFYEKVLNVKKARKCKTNNFDLLRSFAHIKNIAFVVFCLLGFGYWLIFACECFFYAQNLFLKKNCLKIVLITSLCYNTDVHPYQPVYREFICTHLFLSVIICKNLLFL